MNRPTCILALCLLFASCHTFVGKSGVKRRLSFPTKDGNYSRLDTTRFVRRPFDISDHTNKRGFENGKRVIEPIEGKQLRELADKGRRYIVLFTYPCRANRAKIHKLEKLVGSDNILLVSLTASYNYIDSSLKNSSFSQYPYYTIEDSRYSKLLLVREIEFIKEACEKCYEENRDDVMFAEYLVVENGNVRIVMDNDKENILRDLEPGKAPMH